MSSHRNQSTYYPSFTCALTASDVRRIRADIAAAGEAIHWPRLARSWDITIDRAKSLGLKQGNSK